MDLALLSIFVLAEEVDYDDYVEDKLDAHVHERVDRVVQLLISDIIILNISWLVFNVERNTHDKESELDANHEDEEPVDVTFHAAELW